MIKHIVVMKVRQGMPPAQVEAMLAALNRLPLEVPGVKNWTLGKNFCPDYPDNHYAIVCEFDDRASLETYLHHPYHNRIRKEHTHPTLESRSLVDFEF
ncbi:MAG: Dabb family protein [Dehalococcoidia bacterium]|nr:Dabb family protein [Dehalococcoidia bacterium]